MYRLIAQFKDKSETIGECSSYEKAFNKSQNLKSIYDKQGAFIVIFHAKNIALSKYIRA